MKRLVNLNAELKTIGGKTMKVDAETSATIKSIMIDALSLARKMTGVESIRAWNIAVALSKSTEETMDVEDQDAELLKKAIEEQSYMVQVKSPVLSAINEIAKAVEPPQEPAKAE